MIDWFRWRWRKRKGGCGRRCHCRRRIHHGQCASLCSKSAHRSVCLCHTFYQTTRSSLHRTFMSYFLFDPNNVSKLLSKLSVAQCYNTIKSLAYETEVRLRDPMYGCVGFILLLQQWLCEITTKVHNAKELSTYLNPRPCRFF